LEQSLSS